MRADIGINSFAVYEDATEFYGMAEVTLPEVSQIAEEVKAARSQDNLTPCRGRRISAQ